MPKTIVRIHFMDGAVKGFGIEETTTLSQFKEIITEKLELVDHQTFSIFEKRGPQIQYLNPDFRVLDVMHKWQQEDSLVLNPNKDTASSTNSLRAEPYSFVFRKATFFKKEEFSDPVARELTYIQLLHDIVESLCPCSIEDAVYLAGLQFEVIYGPHKEDTHTPGFIEDKIKEFIPKHLLKEKRTKEWESLILKAHQKHSGKNIDGRWEYIKYLKNLPNYNYGTQYFSAKNPNNKKLPDKFLFGVHAEGILLVKKDQELVLSLTLKKEQEVISSTPWTDMVSWVAHPDNNTFAFEVLRDGAIVKYSFETKQAATISQLIGTYVDLVLGQTFKELFR